MLLSSTVTQLVPVSGGDINQVFRAELSDKRRLLVKTQQRALPGLYAAEARGLAWLGQANALRVPSVITATEHDELGPACLVMEWIDSAKRVLDFDERLGCGLAKLHRHHTDGFGLDHDNYIAVLPQHNAPCADWSSFYAERRILRQARLAFDHARIGASLLQRLQRLCEQLPALIGPEEPPARLHGDLWSGNLLVDHAGLPCLIDPAVYAGHREMDLAMMRLFGGFGERVFTAYNAAYPLAPGHAERVALYQLYPLLVHVNLFGGQYVQSVERAMAQLGLSS